MSLSSPESAFNDISPLSTFGVMLYRSPISYLLAFRSWRSPALPPLDYVFGVLMYLSPFTYVLDILMEFISVFGVLGVFIVASELITLYGLNNCMSLCSVYELCLRYSFPGV